METLCVVSMFAWSRECQELVGRRIWKEPKTGQVTWFSGILFICITGWRFTGQTCACFLSMLSAAVDLIASDKTEFLRDVNPNSIFLRCFIHSERLPIPKEPYLLLALLLTHSGIDQHHVLFSRLYRGTHLSSFSHRILSKGAKWRDKWLPSRQ